MQITKVVKYGINLSMNERQALRRIGIDYDATQVLTAAQAEDLRVRIIGSLKDRGIYDFSPEALSPKLSWERTLYSIAQGIEEARQ